jgi:hypothetical protein
VYCSRVLQPCTAAVYCSRVLQPCTAAVYCSRVLQPCTAAVCCSRVLHAEVTCSSLKQVGMCSPLQPCAVGCCQCSYGQGMTVAALQALQLSDLLERRKGAAAAAGAASTGSVTSWGSQPLTDQQGDLSGLSKEFQAAVLPLVQQAWDAAAGADISHGGQTTGEPSRGPRLLQQTLAGIMRNYMATVFELAAVDPQVRLWHYMMHQHVAGGCICYICSCHGLPFHGSAATASAKGGCCPTGFWTWQAFWCPCTINGCGPQHEYIWRLWMKIWTTSV